MSLILQREFGLRRKEALMIQPRTADKGSHLVLKPTWTKGRRSREIPIVTQSQRDAIEQAKQMAPEPRASLIPPHRTYVQQRRLYDKQTRKAGLSNLHGLRHAYAQNRYRALTRALDPNGEGWACPMRGGPSRSELKDPEQARIDEEVRLQISQEMGHGRILITYVYLGA